VPAGGTTGQVLAKTSGTDYAVGWATPVSGGAQIGLLSVSALQSTTLAAGIYTNGGDGLYNYDGTVVRLPGWWHVLVFHHTHNNGYSCQIATELSPDGELGKTSYQRFSEGTTWTEWFPVGGKYVYSTSVAMSAPVNSHIWAWGTGPITLPQTPNIADEVCITALNSGIVIARGASAKPIMRLAEDLTIDRANTTVTLKYLDSSQGWQII